jgi:hypothetical protein
VLFCCLQVCGLKLVESQLLASLAAANARSDAATLRTQRLSAALEAAATKLAAAGPAAASEPAAAAAAATVSMGALASGGTALQQQQQQLGAATALDAASLAAEVARLQGQLLARGQEVFDLQDQLMLAKQVGACVGVGVRRPNLRLSRVLRGRGLCLLSSPKAHLCTTCEYPRTPRLHRACSLTSLLPPVSFTPLPPAGVSQGA